MNAPFAPDRAAEVSGPAPNAVTDAARDGNLDWAHKQTPLAWSVMLYGGLNPRTGMPQPQLEFQFHAGHYTRQRIEQRAADLAEREHRTCWAVREPAGWNVKYGGRS